MILLLVVGTSLVAQPTFIFGKPQGFEDSPYKDTYTLGMVLALTSAFFAGICSVLQINCRSIPLPYYMLWSGFAKLIIGLLCPTVGLPNHITDLHRFEQDFGVLTMTASASMLGLVFTQIGYALSGAPLLISVTRSMEIVMALVVDMVTEPVDFADSHIWYKITGGLLVMVCVVGIAASDRLEEKVSVLCNRRQSRSGYVIIDAEEGSDSETTLITNCQNDYGTSDRYEM